MSSASPREALTRRALGLCALVLAALPLTAAELRVGGGELAEMLQTAFRGTVIRLHSSEGTSAESFIRLGPRLRGETLHFNIPSTDVKLGLGATARYSIVDVTSLPSLAPPQPGTTTRERNDNITVQAAGNSFVLTVRFENHGTEIRGVPSGRLARIRAFTVPDLEVENIAVQIVLSPRSKGLAFDPARVVFLGDVKAPSAQISVFGRRVDILDQLTGYRANVKSSIEREVKKLLDRNLDLLTATVEAEMRQMLAGSGVTVDTMSFEGTTLVLRGRITWK